MVSSQPQFAFGNGNGRLRFSFSLAVLSLLCSTGGCLQVRTSTLESWIPRDDHISGVIGSIRETKDVDQQYYNVQVHVNDEEDPSSRGMQQSRPSNNTSGFSVDLPHMVDESTLGSTMWSSGLATGILCGTAAFHSLVQSKKILELGAGLGLPGRMLAMQDASEVLLTDNDQAVLGEQGQSEGTSPSSILTSQALEWRDSSYVSDVQESGTAEIAEASFDIIIGSDIAYYFYLLRPLMDTIQKFRRPARASSSSSSTCILVGQANRESQWDLYRNIRDGCYNQITDTHEGPWEGRVKMLLYKLRMSDWQDMVPDTICNNNVELQESPDHLKEQPSSSKHTVPIAVLLHENQAEESELFRHGFSSNDYIATKADESTLDMSF